MDVLTTLLLVLGGALILWLIFAAVSRQPQAFRAENLSRSIFILGILALMLIAVITGLVMFLRY